MAGTARPSPPTSVVAMMAIPSDGARRARRGYRYQDLHTLDRYLDCYDGTYETVTAEGDEDVACIYATGHPRYEQVKTVENPRQLWSLALLCEKEQGESSRSILGRLYSGKALPEAAEFVIVLNENVNDSLRVLVEPPDERRADSLEELKTSAAKKLQGVAPNDERSIEWCVARTTVEVRDREGETLQNRVRDRLDRAVEDITGHRLLPEELDDILGRLMDGVEEDARGSDPQAIDRAEVTKRIADAVTVADHPYPDSRLTAGVLRAKLEDAMVDADEIEHCIDMHLSYRRAFRDAASPDRDRLRRISDNVFVACQGIAALRRAGSQEPGISSYDATIAAMNALYAEEYSNDERTDRVDVIRALHDVTSRCRNRYA